MAFQAGQAVIVRTDEGGTFDGTIDEVLSYGWRVRPDHEAVRRALGAAYLVTNDGTYGSMTAKES